MHPVRDDINNLTRETFLAGPFDSVHNAVMPKITIDVIRAGKRNPLLGDELYALLHQKLRQLFPEIIELTEAVKAKYALQQTCEPEFQALRKLPFPTLIFAWTELFSVDVIDVEFGKFCHRNLSDAILAGFGFPGTTEVTEDRRVGTEVRWRPRSGDDRRQGEDK